MDCRGPSGMWWVGVSADRGNRAGGMGKGPTGKGRWRQRLRETYREKGDGADRQVSNTGQVADSDAANEDRWKGDKEVCGCRGYTALPEEDSRLPLFCSVLWILSPLLFSGPLILLHFLSGIQVLFVCLPTCLLRLTSSFLYQTLLCLFWVPVSFPTIFAVSGNRGKWGDFSRQRPPGGAHCAPSQLEATP